MGGLIFGLVCYVEGVAIIHYTLYPDFSAPTDITPAWRVIRGDLCVDSFLLNPQPPTCCAETQFGKNLRGTLTSTEDPIGRERVLAWLRLATCPSYRKGLG